MKNHLFLLIVMLISFLSRESNAEPCIPHQHASIYRVVVQEANYVLVRKKRMISGIFAKYLAWVDNARQRLLCAHDHAVLEWLHRMVMPRLRQSVGLHKTYGKMAYKPYFRNISAEQYNLMMQSPDWMRLDYLECKVRFCRKNRNFPVCKWDFRMPETKAAKAVPKATPALAKPPTISRSNRCHRQAKKAGRVGSEKFWGAFWRCIKGM